MLESLRLQRESTRAKLAKLEVQSKKDAMKARAYERKIWVLDGVLDHDLRFAQLE